MLTNDLKLSELSFNTFLFEFSKYVTKIKSLTVEELYFSLSKEGKEKIYLKQICSLYNKNFSTSALKKIYELDHNGRTIQSVFENFQEYSSEKEAFDDLKKMYPYSASLPKTFSKNRFRTWLENNYVLISLDNNSFLLW
jgi:hypothetical protein